MYFRIASWCWCSTTEIAHRDPGCLPRSSGASSPPRGVDHLFHYQGCAPRAPLFWSHSTRSWMPMEYSYTLASGKRPGPPAHGSQCTLAGGQSPSTRSCRCIILCRVSGSVMCELRPSSHRTIGVMLRSVEASSKASEAIGTGSSLSRLALQPASIYSRVSKDYAAAVVSARQVAQAATTLRCRQDQSTSVSQTPQLLFLVEGFTWVTCGSISTSGQ